jgi:hypothetical protein
MPDSKFNAEDLDLLAKVIEVIPNLTEVAHALRLARKGLKYPVKNRDELLKLLEGKKSVKLGSRSITSAAVQQFMLDKFFPVDSEEDLIRKLLIAFQIGDIYHTEDILSKAKPDDGPHSLLPGPVFNPKAYLALR